MSVPTNPPNQSYTKKELRLLLKDPTVNLESPKGSAQPVSKFVLKSRAKKALDKLKISFDDWLEWKQVPAHVCKAILTGE